MYRVKPGTDSLEILLAARFALVDRVCAEVEGLLGARGLRDFSFVVLLGLREALTNAICHGAGQDRGKIIGVTVRCEKTALVIRVTDPGPGFDWKRIIREKLAAMRQQPALLAERGRGLGILLHYFDAVSFNNEGNVVVLELCTAAAKSHESEESSQERGIYV
ncbi:ATP-binding protein [Thiovibrio sp. JS02]